MATKAKFQIIPGLALFGTTYDPLDLASDSIDPLGFLKAYLALADRLLPGFTTVTGVPRYFRCYARDCELLKGCTLVTRIGNRLKRGPSD